MNRGIPTLVFIAFFLSTSLFAANPDGDLRIQLLDYYNLVVDHNIQTPNGASPRAIYIGVKFCNDGANDLTDVFAYIGNYTNQTPGIYPTTTPSGMPYSGTFSFTHEGGTPDATRYIGDLATGACITQYWLLSYPLLDANGNRVTGSKPNQSDDLHLRYDVWATAIDAGIYREANASKTLQCRAMISASANKIWPNTTAKVPNELLTAFPDKQLGWRRSTNTTHPGASVVLEGIWFDLGNIGQGFDNDGDLVPDGNFLLQPVGNPALFDANCFRLVKVWGLVALKGGGQGVTYIEFEDRMHFANNSASYNGGVGMIFYEFAILNGPCSSTLSPYQQVASGMNEKHNGDYGKPGGTLLSARPNASFDKTAPAWAQVGEQIQFNLSLSNTSSVPLGLPQRGAPLVFQDTIPAHTSYVAGSAAAGNTLPAGTQVKILYSSDNGITWETNEPSPASSVTNIQWWLNKPLATGASATMTFDVVVAYNYPQPVLYNTGGVSLGNSTPFLTDETATFIKGGYVISGVVFSDDGSGSGGVVADGIKNGSEPGLPSVTVKLYYDRDANGAIGTKDILIASQPSAANGSYSFQELSDGSYLVAVDYEDADLPTRWTNTSPLLVQKSNLASGNTPVNFGFSPLLSVQNLLTGVSPVYENDLVSYQVSLTNRAHAQPTANTTIVTAWASAVDGATTFEVSPANMLGPPDGLYTTSNLYFQRKAVVKGFNFGSQTAGILKVELLFKIYLEDDVKNDKMFAKLTLGNGTTVTLPNPKWGKNTSPSLNDYIGASKAGWLTLDVTNLQNWNWTMFDSNWKLTLEGQVQGQDDGPRIHIDAIGVRITKDCCAGEGGGSGGQSGDPHSTISLLPVTYEYDAEKLAFISATVVPDSTSPGILFWQNRGPLYPGQTTSYNLNFRALQPPVSLCALTAPECTSVPNPYTQCAIPSSGYFADVTVSGNVNWSAVLPGVSASSMDKKVRLKGSGTVTIPSGDLKLLNSSSLLVVDGVTLILNNGNFILESSSIAIFKNATLRTYGNIDVKLSAYFCMTNGTLECGDEQVGGLFNTGGSSTSANFNNDGGKRYLENVCMNVTHDFFLSSASTSEDIMINVCAEIGDRGQTQAASGIVDGNDSGNFTVTKMSKIYNSEFTVVENISVQSGGTLQACNVNLRTLNGNFSNTGTFKGCEINLWVDDGHSISCNGAWTANVEKRRGPSSLGLQYIPANSTVAQISPLFNQCACTPPSSGSSAVITDAVVTDAVSADGLPVNQANDEEQLVVLDRGSVSGYIFSDKNSNGWQGTFGYETGTDYFLEGVVVNLYGCTANGQLMYPAPNTSRSCTHGNNGGTWTLLATDTTKLNGSYAFKGLKNGYYYVSVTTSTLPGTVTQRADPDQTTGVCTTCDNRWKNPSSNVSQVGIIGSANDFIHVNFGYSISPSMGGYVFEDKNGNGIKDQLESYLAGVIVERVSGGCTFGVNCPTATTNANGRFSFNSLTTGTSYTLKVRMSSLPAGGTWSITAESDGTTNNAITLTLAAGQQNMSNFFGVNQSGTSDFSGTVYYDWTNNGMKNSSDEGIANVSLRLFRDLNNNGSVDNGIDLLIRMTQTDALGNYVFLNNAAGNYIIVVDDGTLPITPLQTADPDEEGLCSVCDGQAVLSGVNGTTDRSNIDFGYGIATLNRPSFYIYNRLGGSVFSDTDGNGLKSPLEAGLENITVELWGDLNLDDVYTLVSSNASLPDGSYVFEGLPDGRFMIVVDDSDEDLPAGTALSTLSMYSFTIVEGEVTLLNGVACNGCDVTALDFGFAPLGGIESFVFYDNNGNGQQDWNEDGIPGVRLYLCPTGGGACNAGNALASVFSTSTEPAGAFRFDGLMPGIYTVAVDVSTLPPGITANSLTADPSTDGIPCYYPLNPADPNFVLLSGGCDNKVDNLEISFGRQYAGAGFGYRPAGVIGELVWFDANGNGVKDSNENGMNGVQLQVTNLTTVIIEGTTYNPNQYTRTTTTDFDGRYAFNRLPDATWRVEVFPPAGYTTTFEADGTFDSRVDVVIFNGNVTSTGNSWCPSGSDCSLAVNFGLRPSYSGTLSGTVCLDSDQDGRCNTGGETFPPGVNVFLHDRLGNMFGQTVVNNAGFYQFTHLPNDTFTVSVAKSTPPLQLTTLTTSLGDTPAFFIQDSDDNASQKVKLNGNMTGVDFGFAFTDTFDLGDLPLPYPTEVKVNAIGPVHILPPVPTLYLGSAVDAEFFPSLHVDANGDDNSGTDDEDGILFTNTSNWEPGTVATGKGGSLTATVAGNGWLTAWADFNEDGDFTDAGEMVLNRTVSTGSFNHSFDIPAGTALSGGQKFYFRFRLFAEAPLYPNTAFAGIAEGGEVEDYVVSICKNLSSPGSIAGAETGCDNFDPALITESSAPGGGGGALEYQWQQSTNGGVTWTTIAGATAATFDPAPISQTTHYRRGARRSSCTDFTWSNMVAKSILSNFTNPGIITGEENYCGIYDPDIILSSVAPSGGSGSSSPEYQWQKSTDSITWMDIINANAEYYNPGVISQTTFFRRGARKSPCQVFLYSNVVSKRVVINFTSAGAIAGDENYCGGYDPTLITSLSQPAGGTDGSLQYQWELSTNGGVSWTNISGATGETYNPPPISTTTLYRRKARRMPCSVWVNSNVVTKTVRPYPLANIAELPSSPSGYLCELTDYQFRAADAGAGVTYAWNFGTYADPASAAGMGPHTVQFDVPNNTVLTNTTVGLSVTKDGCVSNTSASLTFRPVIQFLHVELNDPTSCNSTNGDITIAAIYPAGASIQYSINGGASWFGSSYFGNLGAGTYDIRARYVGGDCMVAYGIVALSDPPPQADLLVSVEETCAGEVVTFEAVPDGSNPTFAWAFGSGAVPNTASGPGPHSIVFNNGGPATIAVTMIEAGCVGVRDTTILIVKNFTSGGTILGGETLCGSFDPNPIVAGANPSGGSGGELFYEWEYRQSDGAGGWGPWQVISGANGAGYDPGVIAITTEYRRKARRSPCSSWVTSNTVIARLVPKPQLTDDNYFVVCPGYPHASNVSDNDANLVNPLYSILIAPSNGTLDFEPDGEFIYAPNSTFCGTDEFHYIVCNDGTGCCDTARVLIDLTDSEPPAIVNVPPHFVIGCDDQIPVAASVNVVENCQNVSLGMDEVSTKGTDNCAVHNYQLMRIWTGVDYCTNGVSEQQVITVEDKTAPDIFRIYKLPNGKRMVAGVMENVSQHWKTVRLPVTFSTPPVVFAQIITKRDNSAAIARLRNVSTTQFQLRLQEEEGNDGVHPVEEVAWVAFEKGTFSGQPSPFEVGSWLLTSIPVNKVFSQSYAGVPHFLTTLMTNNEDDAANVRFSNLGGSSVDVWLQEEHSMDAEATHGLETVGYLVFQNSGNITDQNGEVIGETGRVTLTESLSTIQWQHRYHNPVVVFGGISTSENEPVTVRVKDLSPTSFKVQLQEWDYQDGQHLAETISYLVVEGSLPLDRTVSCDAIPAPLAIGSQIVAVDNCDNAIQLVMTESSQSFNCQSDTTFTRTWRTEDDCGNVTMLTQTYYLTDVVPPTFTVPKNLTIVCGSNKDNLDMTGRVLDEQDNCTTNLTAVYTDNLSNLSGCDGYIVRTWTLSDNCGNSTVKQQLIFVASYHDTDGDGVPDYFDLDDDNDGIPDVVETNADNDGDGVPNHLDLDSDNDGIPDLIEAGGTDANGDGRVDNQGNSGWDHDGDGFAFGHDANDIDSSLTASNSFNPNSPLNDRDGDGVPNYLDLDSDNDGIPDLIEAGGIDTDGNGRIDYPVPNDPTSMPDADGDGFYDRYDPDDDNLPGIDDPADPLVIFDGYEYRGGITYYRVDFDGDGVPDFFDLDSDNDGIPDLIEVGGVDTNGDGRIELTGFFLDLNNDGFDDKYASLPLITTDADGIPVDGRPSDTNGNGSAYNGGDADYDNSSNPRDLDSDNDRIFDIFEIGLFARDSNNNGIIDNWNDYNNNGMDDIAEIAGVISTESDGYNADGRPEDGSDADFTFYRSSQSDGFFAQSNSNPDVDDDGDGIPNFLDTDSDNDYLYDRLEDRNSNGRPDEGETGLYNQDSDGDGIIDGLEDFNRNGLKDANETDPLNPNSDGDPLDDGLEDANQNGIHDEGETDPRDPCDPFLSAACKGLALDIKLRLYGAMLETDTSGLMNDNLRMKFVMPVKEPYTIMTHLHHIGDYSFEGNNPIQNYNYKEAITPGLLYFTGGDAPVDWVLVELRAMSKPDSIVATRAAILQRDGDVRDIDGLSYVTFKEIPSGYFYVAVRHRNHLGVMTAEPYLLSPTVTTIDFTNPATEVYGNNAMVTFNGVRALWPGDFNGDGKIIYQGPNNDVLQLFQRVIINELNTSLLANFVLDGYLQTDLNLDGNGIYQGPNNDRAKLLIYSVLKTPENTTQLANFIVLQKLP